MDAAGIPVGFAVDGANLHDMKLVKETLSRVPIDRPKPTKDSPQDLYLDQGYDYDEVREIVAEIGFTSYMRSRGEEAKAIRQEAGFKARRRGGERTQN